MTALRTHGPNASELLPRTDALLIDDFQFLEEARTEEDFVTRSTLFCRRKRS